MKYTSFSIFRNQGIGFSWEKTINEKVIAMKRIYDLIYFKAQYKKLLYEYCGALFT